MRGAKTFFQGEGEGRIEGKMLNFRNRQNGSIEASVSRLRNSDSGPGNFQSGEGGGTCEGTGLAGKKSG